MEKIDLVYLWVDGNDPVWQQQKQKAMAESGREFAPQAVAKGRFVDNEELKYSLRSVAENAPWINRIFIITAGQKPSWLNDSHPQIRIVDHTEILKADYLPTFNSTAIEMSVALVEGLSEKFIFSNDDMFILKPITPSFFYNPEGLPIARFARHISTKQSLYLDKVRNAQRLVREKYGESVENNPHHNMDAYLRSDVVACSEAFAEEVEESRSHRFRTAGEFHRSAWLYYAVTRGRAEKKIVRHYSAAQSPGEKLRCRLSLRYCTDSKEIGLHRGNLARRVRKYNPTLLCLNDTERTTDSQREEMRVFLERQFPNKSPFEK